MPKISVIIPVYNHGDELAACLRSLERQTEKDFEIIIVDDGSTNSVAGATIRFENNRGAPIARNAGFSASMGEYVIFLDADAELVPEALARMREALDQHPEVDFAYPSFKFGFKTFKSRPFDKEALTQGNYIHTSALIRRSAFPGFDESLKKFQDWDLFLTMAEQGKRGFFIEEVLYSLKPRKTGMSQWLPSFAYDLPWHVLGWMPRLVKKYKDAERIIRQKHGIAAPIPVASRGNEAKFFLLIVLVELLSIPAVWNPDLNSALAMIAGGLMLAVAYYRPTTALGLLVLEFMIGSKGRLLVYGSDANNDGGVSLRIILFAAFFVGWLLARGRFASWRLPPPFLALVGLVLYASWMGWALAQPFIFADANAWGVLLLIIPILDLSRADTSFWPKIKQVIMVGIAWLILKSIALFFLFSHAFDAAFLESVYRWVRRTGVGEITALSNGGVSRVFIQSQVYILLAAVYLAMQAAHQQRVNRNLWAAFTLCLIAVLISFSRSFWIALAIGSSFCAIIIIRRKSWVWFRNIFVAFLLALLSVIGVALFPVPPSTAGNPVHGFSARVKAGEAAATSRWELLPILFQKAMESPILGHGFGTTVTYRSADPRVLQKTGGLYTTYAFEWGWMDLWIKFGFLGPIAMLWLLVSIGKKRLDLAAIILTLAIVHMFTPYLNHPLGLLCLALLWAVAMPAETQIGV